MRGVRDSQCQEFRSFLHTLILKTRAAWFCSGDRADVEWGQRYWLDFYPEMITDLSERNPISSGCVRPRWDFVSACLDFKQHSFNFFFRFRIKFMMSCSASLFIRSGLMRILSVRWPDGSTSPVISSIFVIAMSTLTAITASMIVRGFSM